jgi:hypothetical protein
LFITSILSARKAWRIVHHIRPFTLGDEIASLVFGQAFARGPGFP